jgi:hypothetical protein
MVKNNNDRYDPRVKIKVSVDLSDLKSIHKQVKNIFDKSKKPIKDSLDEIIEQTLTIGKDLAGSFKDGKITAEEFAKAVKNMLKGLSGTIAATIGDLLQNTLSGIGDAVPIIGSAISAVIDLLFGLFEIGYNHKVNRLIKEHTEEVENQKSLHTEINNLINQRQQFLEIAKKLHLSNLDSLQEEIEYNQKIIEQLKQRLGLEGLTNQEIADQIINIQGYINALEYVMSSLEDYQENTNNWRDTNEWLSGMESYLNSIGLSWEELDIDMSEFGTHLSAAERESLLGIITRKLEALGWKLEDLNGYLDTNYDTEQLIKKEIEEQWKIRQIEAELVNDITGSYDAQIGYIEEMIRRADEFNLSTLERLELEQELQNLYEKRFEKILSRYDKEMELYILKAKLQGASEEQLLELQLEQVENLIEAKKIEIEQLGSTIDREIELAELEEERLKLQQEINGELAQQGILLDKNVQRILQQVINTRLLGDLEAQEQSISNAISVLQGQGYSNQEIADLLGIDISSISGGIGSTDYSLPELPDFSLSERFSKMSLGDVNNLSELQTQTMLLTEQNDLLRQMLGIQKTTKKADIKYTPASQYHRMVKKLDEQSFS